MRFAAKAQIDPSRPAYQPQNTFWLGYPLRLLDGNTNYGGKTTLKSARKEDKRFSAKMKSGYMPYSIF